MPDRQMASNGHSQQPDAQPAMRITVPLPTLDNAGEPFPEADICWFEAILMRLAGGFRKYLFVRGAWHDHGIPYDEPCAVYVTTVQAPQLSGLMALLDEARQRFRQQALWIEQEAVTSILLTTSALSDSGDRDSDGLAVHHPVAYTEGENNAAETDRRVNGHARNVS